MPVENEKETGWIDYFPLLLRHYATKDKVKKKETPYMVEDIMIASPKIIHPEASILDAMNTMRENKVDVYR
ncbi:MAG: hypothetical protein R2784_07650 [Saprospiraceae bacterium]